MTQTPPPSPLLLAARRRPADSSSAPNPPSRSPNRRARAAGPHRPVRQGSPYRLLLAFEADPDAAYRVREELERWLREKHGGDPSLAVSADLSFADARVTIVHRPDGAEGYAFRFRHEHHTSLGVWTTVVAMSASPRNDGWLLVETRSEGGNTAAKPRFIDSLLDILDLKDGSYPLSASTRLVSDEEDVEALVEAICDPDRQGLLFVAGTYVDSPLSLEDFRRRLDKWTQRVRGIAQSVILTPLATKLFNEAIGTTHRVDPGTVRTYYLDVDPAVAVDAKRHRILSERRIMDSTDDEVRSILVPKSQRHASSRRYPTNVTQVLRALTRIEDRLFVSSLQADSIDLLVARRSADPSTEPSVEEAASPRAPLDEAAAAEVIEAAGAIEAVAETLTEETNDYLELLAVLDRSLGLDGDVRAEAVEAAIVRRLDQARSEARAQAQDDRRAFENTRMQSMQARLDERQARLEELEDELAETEKAIEEMALENAVVEDERRKRAAEAYWLRTQLQEAGAYDAAYAEAPNDAYVSAPESMADLAEAIDAFNDQGIYFSADRGVTAELVDQDSLGTMVAFAWEVVLVMVDYARAKRERVFDGSLKAYLESPPNGYRTTTPQRFGERESKGDMQQYGHLRVFPLPAGVERDGVGEATMEMHWKLPRCGIVTPRMHFLDSTGVDGKIYIGYCGPHLRSRRTN